MLTDLKVSFLACKCVFYRPKHNAKDPIELDLEGLEKQKWNIATDRAQIVEDKNWVICLVIMCILGSYGH